MTSLLVLLGLTVAVVGVVLAARAGVVLTARAALVPLAALPLLLVAETALVAVASLVLLLCLVAVDVARCGPPRAVTVAREGTGSTRLGQEVAHDVVLRETSGRRLRGRVHDRWPPSAGRRPGVHAVDVPALGVTRLRGVLRPTRRGDRRAAPLTVRRRGPVGVAGRQGDVAAPGSLRVLPAFASRKHLPERLARLRLLEGATVAPVRGQGTEFDSLREYVPGDDVRSVDWRATARRSSVVVRTWRPERDRRLLLVVDTSRTSAGRLGDDVSSTPRLDLALDAALLLGALAERAGDRVGALAVDSEVRGEVRADAGRALPALSEAFVGLEPALVELDARLLVASVQRRTPQRSLVVLLSELSSEAWRAGLLEVLGALTSRHTVVVAAVRDPRVLGMAAGREDAAAVYAAAAAEAALADRERLADELRRRGVVVVDAGPDEVAPRLADTYLDLKAAGRL